MNVLVKALLTSLDKHKGEEICVLDVRTVTSLADTFILASGSSSTMVKSLADYCEKEAGAPNRIEGYVAGNWVAMDYGDTVVHLFQRETRVFYDLERLWRDAKKVEWEKEIGEWGRRGIL